MSAFARPTLLGLSLALAAALSAAVIALELRAGAAEPAPPAPQAPEERLAGAAAQSFTFPPPAHYSEIVERTLFDPSRRPAPEEPEEMAAAVSAELREFALTGVIITPESRIALLRDRTPNPLRVEQGGTVGKWLLAEVNETSVVLRRGALSREISLYEDEDAARAKQAAATPLPSSAIASPAADGTAAATPLPSSVIASPADLQQSLLQSLVPLLPAYPQTAPRAGPGESTSPPSTRAQRRARRRGAAMGGEGQ